MTGISVRELQKDVLSKLKKKGYETSISEISVFELLAKGAKHIDRILLQQRLISI